jgi:hypothetical protein
MRGSLARTFTSSVIFLLFPLFVQAQASSFSVGTATAAPGQKSTGYLEVPPGVDAATNIPVIVVNGEKRGPVLALVSGAHGTEYTSIIAIEKLINILDPSQIAGTVILVPLVNIQSWVICPGVMCDGSMRRKSTRPSLIAFGSFMPKLSQRLRRVVVLSSKEYMQTFFPRAAAAAANCAASDDLPIPGGPTIITLNPHGIGPPMS